jgi:hypothetical protein
LRSSGQGDLGLEFFVCLPQPAARSGFQGNGHCDARGVDGPRLEIVLEGQ